MKNTFLALIAFTAAVGVAFAASATHPNEPTGYQIIAESPVDTMPTTSAQGNTPAGWTGLWYRQASSNYWLTTETDAPTSLQSVFVSRFQDGLPGGSSPGLNALQGWSNRPLSSVSDQYQSEYFTFWVRINGTQFYMNNNGLKFSYFGFGRSPGTTASNEGILILEGGGSQHFYGSAFKVHYYLYHDGNNPINQNVNTQKLVTVGPWHQVELLQTLNTPGQSNGVLRVWIDGTLVIDRSNVVFLINGNNAGFYSWKWEPTWGGGLTPHVGVDYMEIDHVYLSGIPLGGSGSNCGNGQIDAGEQCDGSNLNGASCTSLGFTGGPLSCSGACQYNTNSCTSSDTTNPTVSFTAPAASSTVSGTVGVSASATDNVAVQSVLFQVDGVNIAAADTSSPYSVSWDTTGATNAQHTLTAIATDTSGNTATATRTVTVSNVVANCGNGQIDPGEQCDGSNLNGASCISRGFTGGTLSCSSCQYDTTGCTSSGAPVILAATPEGNLPGTTTSVTTTVTTDIAATCAWNSASGLAWASLSPFTNTGGTTHTRNFGATLAQGNTYRRYIRCRTSAGIESAEYNYSFTIGTPTPPPKTGDLNGDGIVNILDVQRVVTKLGQPNVTTGEDLNADGTVNIYDLVVLAQNWG